MRFVVTKWFLDCDIRALAQGYSILLWTHRQAFQEHCHSAVIFIP